MDDFAVDLDKVLDDFELSEGERAIQQDKQSHIKKDDRLDATGQEQLHADTTSTEENNSCVPSLCGIPYDTHHILDVVDGDFGSKGLGSDLQPNINTTDGGYFVPEGASDSADDADDHMPGMLNGPAVNMFCYDGQPVGHVGSGLSAFSVYDEHRYVDLAPAEFVPDNHVTPELLHNAFDAVGLADPDSDTEPSMRPSFMSSSPPNVMALGGISQPDVVPAMMDAQLNVSLPCCELADDLQQTVTMSCSRDDTVHTSEVPEGDRSQIMMAEEANTDSPHSSMVMSCSYSGELEKEIIVTNEGRMRCDDAIELVDSVNLEDSTVETPGSDTADIIMDIQGVQQTSSGSSVSLPDVSSLNHPVGSNADQSAEPMNFSVVEKTSPVGFGTIETDDAGDDTMENRLAEMAADRTCHKNITAPGQQTTVAENVENNPAMAPCNCDAMQNEQDTGTAGVEQGADVEGDFKLPRDTLNCSYVDKSSEQTHSTSSPQEAGAGTASMSECLTMPGESQGRCDLGETFPTQSLPDTATATSTAEISTDVLTSSSNDSSALTSRCDDGSAVPGPVVGLEGNPTTMAVEQDSNTVTSERTAECDIADKTTQSHADNITTSEMVQENMVDAPSDVTQPALVIGQPMTMQGVGARPKEHVVRRNRPNSLLGLSKPDVGPVAVEKPVNSEKAGVLGCGVMGAPMSGLGSGIISSPMPGFGGGVIIENSHDLINMQLAQQRTRSPLEKQQLNLEIRQHTSGPVETQDNELPDNRSVNDIVSQSDSVPQVCSETMSPTLPHPNVRSAKPPCSLDVSSSYSPAPSGGDTVTQQGILPQQRRPCSLTIHPREDFQQELRSVQDVDTPMVSDSPTATGDYVAPNTAAISTEAIPPSPASGLVAPPSSINPNLPITELGKMAPVWLPDAEAPNCMQCDAKFTFTRRRHHCRCCGKVFCSGCCNLKVALAYLEEKEARVCSCCYQDLIRAQVYEKHHSAAAVSPRPSPNPNNPCLQKKGEPKQVIFSDGIRPGGDLTELDAPSSQPQLPVQKAAGRKAKKTDKTKQNDKTSPKNSKQQNSNKNRCLIPANGLPPVILPTGVKGDFSLEENPEPGTFMPQIRSIEDPSPVAFAINKNLFVMVKIVNLDCCVNRVCLCFSTKGMCTVAQDEIVIILQCLPDEKTVPRDIFVHLFNVYDSASKGNTVSNLDHSVFTENILGSKDYGGFLYIRPSFQCLHKLKLLPQPPYVIGILLQKWEIPWAKVFPVRLMLRLGAEYRYYPCPLISVRDRKPVYGEIGHTIMNLLADFRNYQYQLMCVRGLVVHMEEKRTYINLPRNRYNEVMKVISNSNDYVMAFGANFSQQADSHLVCIQNDDGNYQTQAINIQNKPRKVTGASFVVFNGALKASSGLRAKSSIVEDGLMVQVMAETMSELKQALHAMEDYTIGCGSLQTPEPEEFVVVKWVEDDRNVNVGVKSPIDGKTMDGIQSIRIHSAMDCVGDSRNIRWTEVFFIENEDHGTSRCEPVDLSRLAETLARACCLALVSHLDLLKDAGLTRLALRATIDSERVGYEVGGNGSQLPPFYMNSLDSELIPVIHSAASSNQQGPIVLELIFHIIE